MPRLSAFALFAAPMMLAACGTGEAPDAGSSAATSAAGAATQTSPATTTPSPAAPTAGDTPSASPTVDEGDSCGASKVSGRWLNSLPSDDVKAAIADAVGERRIRYYAEGDAITMDYSEDRLNVVLGKDGRIKEFRCG